MSDQRYRRDPARPCFVISVAASMVEVHPRTLRIYEDEGLLAPARTPTNIRLYSENDIRRILWIRRLTQERGVNLAGVRLLFDLEERLGTRILEALFDETTAREAGEAVSRTGSGETAGGRITDESLDEPEPAAFMAGAAGAEPATQSRRVTRIVATRVAKSEPGDRND